MRATRSESKAVCRGGDSVPVAVRNASARVFHYRPTRRLTTDRLVGMFRAMVRIDPEQQRDLLLKAAESVVLQQGVGCLTLDAVAAAAGVSKGGLLHHFPSKDLLVEALVLRSANLWRECYCDSYERTPAGPGRMTRALLDHCLTDVGSWTEDLKRSSSACFAALAQNPSLIEPMRETYADLHRRVADDGLQPGVGEAVAAAIDGLWLYWVLGLADVNQDLAMRVKSALEDMVSRSLQAAKDSSTDNETAVSEGEQS